MLEELKTLDEQLNDMRAEKYASMGKIPENEAEEAAPDFNLDELFAEDAPEADNSEAAALREEQTDTEEAAAAEEEEEEAGTAEEEDDEYDILSFLKRNLEYESKLTVFDRMRSDGEEVAPMRLSDLIVYLDSMAKS